MDAVVLVLMLLVVFMTSLKLTFMKWWQTALVAAVCALFVGLIWPIAIEQSRNEIDQWLSNQQLMLDTSVIITLEVILQIAYCMLSARLMYEGQEKKRTIILYKILRTFPGVLIFPVLFFLLIQVIYAFSGVSFSLIAWCLAGAVLILLPAFTWLLRFILPEKSIRLEMLFMIAVVIMVLGIVATVNGTTNFKGSDPVEWSALLAFCILLLVCSAGGYLVRKIKTNK